MIPTYVPWRDYQIEPARPPHHPACNQDPCGCNCHQLRARETDQ